MSKLGINALNKYLKTDLKVEVLEKYWDFHILSEADLQSVVWSLLTEFISKVDSKPERFKVLNKPYLKGLGIHPDIVIFRKEKPWVVIELKERRELSEGTARKELDRLLKSRDKFKAKKGYLLYVARFGDGRTIRGPKGSAARFFSEIPIILQSIKTPQNIEKWENEFKRWSKYVGD